MFEREATEEPESAVDGDEVSSDFESNARREAFGVPERKRLLELVNGDSRFSPERRVRFNADMELFEKRIEKQQLPQEEVSRTYEQLSRILQSDVGKTVSNADKSILARQMIAQAADPTTIDQGLHSTCNVTALESVFYTKSPSKATKLVADLAVEGSYKTSLGTKITLTPDDYVRDVESRLGRPQDRSFATQLFNIAATNIYYSEHMPNFYYTNDPSVGGVRDTGERLWNREYDRIVQNRAQLGPAEMTSIFNSISGENRNDWILQSLIDPPFNKLKEERLNGVHVDDEETLAEILEQMKREHWLPVTVVVHTGCEPFLTDAADGTTGGATGWHVVNVTDYDPVLRMTAVDNQWESIETT